METTPKSAPPEPQQEATEKTEEERPEGTRLDALHAYAAQALLVAQNALEAVARFLDSRAKLVGDLATKLAPSSNNNNNTKNEASTSQESPASP